MKITAKEARELAAPTFEEIMDETYRSIRRLAECGGRTINLTRYFWEHGGYDMSSEWVKGCEELRNAGFQVEYVYEERQFVYMTTKVSW